MKRLVECVPNFSEGRDASKIDAIVAAMREVPGVFLLDRESDADHNRSVVTLAGEPEAVAEAALRGVGKAAELIDLTRHTGAHPRMGATDVVPFIPIEGVTIEDCVALAKKEGRVREVKGMGGDVRARNLAQVSINLTDFEQTPIHRVFEMVKREAERYGVTIVGSEIVGLIPKRAIELTADFYLQLENFSPAQ